MNKAIIGLLVLLSLSGWVLAAKPIAIKLDGSPDASAQSLQGIKAYTNVRSANLRGWLDDSLLVTTQFGQTRQLHIVKNPGGSRKQITFEQEPIRFAITGRSNLNGVIYGIDEGGRENYQLYHYDPIHSVSTKLTKNRARHTDPRWSKSGKYIAFSTTVRNGKDTDIHILDLESGDEIPVLQQSGLWYVMDWSFDDRKLLVAKYNSINHINLYEVDVRSGIRSRLDSQSNFAASSQTLAKYSPSSKGIWFLSDFGTQFRTLRYRNRDQSDRVTSYTDEIPHDVTDFAVSPDGNTVFFVVNQEGKDKLYRLQLRGNRHKIITDDKGFSKSVTRIHGLDFSPDGKKLAVSAGSSSFPGDVFVITLRKFTINRWTESELGALENQDLPEPELLKYVTFDKEPGKNSRRKIPAFVYKPFTGGPFPVLIYIHGGPESQSRPVFRPFLHYLLKELKIAVIYPNVRGSTGYGKEYTKLDNAFRRKDAVRDIEGLIDWIGTQPDLDKEKVAVMGGSYGGFMSLASLVEYSSRLKAGISTVGISDFNSFLKNTKPYRVELRRQEYGDERDLSMQAYFRSISPLRNADKIKTPLLIAQGKNDPRVHYSESEQIVQAVRNNGKEVWYMLAENEGHGFRQKENREYYYALVADFLRKHLIGESIQVEAEPTL